MSLLRLHPVATRAVVAVAAAVATLAFGFGALLAQDIRFFRIGTGSTAGVNFSIGTLLASVVSNPPGSRPCDRGGSCGVPGLIAVVQATQGSVANAREIGAGTLDSGIVQADVAGQAYHGRSVFAGKNRQPDLRALASLYPEILQIVVRRDSGIASLGGLKGKRVSLDTDGSGTQIAARLVLARAGVRLADIKAVRVDLGAAVDMMRTGQLDAFFYVGGIPAPAIAELGAGTDIDLISLPKTLFERIAAAEPAYRPAIVPAGIYPGSREADTLGVYALWLASANLDDRTAYELLRALWHRNSRVTLAGGHPNGRLIAPETALDGLTLPLHPGAERFYRELNLLTGGEPSEAKPPDVKSPAGSAR